MVEKIERRDFSMVDYIARPADPCFDPKLQHSLTNL